MSRTNKLRLAYEFLISKRESQEAFTLQEISVAANWKPSTPRTYLHKHWSAFIEPLGSRVYRVRNDFDYPFDVFSRICSQSFLVNKDPFRPILSARAESLVAKSREAALLAVQIYNNPTIAFRTPGFIVHMIIAFTSLFHASLEESGVDFQTRDDNGTPILIDGRPKFWELAACVRHRWGSKVDAQRKNLEFFIGLRNEIEHRFAPQFDATIAGECQALLMNYEATLTAEFTSYYALGTQVAVPIQISRTLTKARLDALRRLYKDDYDVLREYVDQYRNTLSDDIMGSTDYTFRVYLIPKPANRQNTADVSMEFIPFNEASKETIEALRKGVTLLKTKEVPVANQGKYLPKEVVAIIQRECEPRFRMHEHSQAWRMYNVRPSTKSGEGCNPRFCQFDKAHNDFVYTEEWIDLLKDKLKDPAAYESIRRFRRNTANPP